MKKVYPSLETLAKNKIETDKNNFLINALVTASKILKENDVFTPTYEGSTEYTYVSSHAERIGEQIATEIGGRFHNFQIILTNDTARYCIDLRSCDDILKSLKSELAIDWAKTTYKQNDKWEWKQTPLFRKQSLPKDPILDKSSWRNIAESFNSASEISVCDEYINAENNYLTAVNAGTIKGTRFNSDLSPSQSKGLIEIFKPVYEAWQEIYKIGLNTDYEAVARWKAENHLNTLADTNEAIEALKEPFESVSIHYQSKRSMYDLFRAFDLTPVNDFDLFISLYAAQQINTEVKEVIWNDESTERLMHKEVKMWANFDEYLNDLKTTLNKEKEIFTYRYMLKNGGFKKVSHRERGARERVSKNLEKDSNFLKAILKNERTIKKYLI